MIALILIPVLSALLLFALHPLILSSVGDLLVFEKSDFQNVDALVVLPGSVPDRVLQAFELIEQSRAERVLLPQVSLSAGDRLLREMGIPRLSHSEINRLVLLHKGVPADRIRPLPIETRSTWEDVLALRAYMERHPLRSVAIVTCRYHSYRAYLNFRLGLEGTGVKLYVVPAGRCEFDERTWWKDRDGVQAVGMELSKLIAFLLGRR